MGLIGRQFGDPTGPVGRLVGRFMARSNAGFNRWLVQQVAARVRPAPRRVVELGCGPGVGLEALLAAFPDAEILGVDPSRAMCAQAARRNREAIKDGRLRLVLGDAGAVAADSPVDLIVAVHVLYFLHEPERELRRVADLLAAGGHVALGYQLREHMPPVSQRDFAAEGHQLYESDDELRLVLRGAGFETRDVVVMGDPGSPGGRLLLAARPRSSA
jgi:SAM-dependent methyltransferase